jgi:predicted AlkP superfamily pyrophosphatase or phosphodiesterase
MPSVKNARLLVVSLSLLASLVACASGGSKPSRRDDSWVLLISVDGFRADYLESKRTPTLWKIGERGVRAEGLTPVFPSLTFPNHQSIITGLYAENHGIVSNEMIDPDIPGRRFRLGDAAVMDDPRWWQEGEPLWITAAKQGVKTATMFWPGSSVEVRGHRPTYWKTYDQALSNHARVEQILDWLDLPKEQRPRFLTLYFEEVDSAGHASGPQSPEVDKALANIDSAIGRLLDGVRARGLDSTMNVVVVSDHGMAKIEPAKIIALDAYLPAADFQLVGQGAMASLYPADGKFDAVYAKLKNANPRMQVFKKAEVPARFHYRNNDRIGPIVLLAEEGSYIASSPRSLKAGNHGFDNLSPNMRGLFVAAGPDFKPGVKAKPFENIHIYPLLADILGLQPAKVDGELKVTAPFRR